MKAWLLICICVALVCSSCDTARQAAGTINDLMQVQQTVSKALGTNNVTVNITNGQSMAIGIVNSSLKDLPADQKKAKALEIAQLGYRSYPQAAKLVQVSIAFVVQRSYLGVFNYTNTTDAFTFKPTDLANPEH